MRAFQRCPNFSCGYESGVLVVLPVMLILFFIVLRFRTCSAYLSRTTSGYT